MDCQPRLGGFPPPDFTIRYQRPSTQDAYFKNQHRNGLLQTFEVDASRTRYDGTGNLADRKPEKQFLVRSLSLLRGTLAQVFTRQKADSLSRCG